MPLIGPLEVVGLVTLAVLYATLKLVKWSLNAEEEHVRQVHVNHMFTIYRLFLGVAALLVLWPGLARWATGLWHWLPTVIPW